jgi:outer membrane protein
MFISARPPSSSRPHWLRWLTRLACPAGPALAAVLPVLVASSFLLATAPAEAQSAPPKIAVIDVRRAIAETEQGLRVQATLKKLFDNRQVELETKTRQLQTDKETLEKEAQGGRTPKEALQKKYEKLLQQDAEIQRLQVDAQREMQRKEQELTTPILAGILEAVKRMAAQEGFEMVLEKSAVPYFRGDLELTDRAIQMYNGSAATSPAGPGKGTTPPSTAPAGGKGPLTPASAPGAPGAAKPASPAPKK